MKTRALHILWLTPLAIAVAYSVALVGIRSEPFGYVASYSVFPHAENDVFHFSHGLVTLETCCGEEMWGTYSRSADGDWIWHLRHVTSTTTQEIRVRSGLFSMRFTDARDPSKEFTLRRRLFKELPL